MGQRRKATLDARGSRNKISLQTNFSETLKVVVVTQHVTGWLMQGDGPSRASSC